MYKLTLYRNSKKNRKEYEIKTILGLTNYLKGINDDNRFILLHICNKLLYYHGNALTNWSDLDLSLKTIEKDEETRVNLIILII